MAISDKLKSAWNAFRAKDVMREELGFNLGPPTYSAREPMRRRYHYSGEKTIISSIYTRLAIDVAEIEFKHVMVDDNERYNKDIKSNLNYALLFEPNIDQSSKQLRRDIAMTLFHEGVACIVPVDTNVNPNTNEIFDIFTLRVGSITQWFPEHVTVSLYNEKTGNREEITLEKRFVAIIENPFFSVMNETNSTLQRLIRKLALLDTVDEITSSGKLDIIIQLPYVIKSEARQQQAEKRRQDIEMQLSGGKYGIAYTDGTEKITQLNRPAENNLLKQVEYLQNMLYQQLGITEELMNGTASEETMRNYQNRTIIPIVEEITKALQRSFIGLDRYKKNERIMYFYNPFKFVPLADLAEISDKFTRNEIATANEMRAVIGFVPSEDPKADELRNSNMPQADEGSASAASTQPKNSQTVDQAISEMDSVMNEILDGIQKDVDDFTGGKT